MTTPALTVDFCGEQRRLDPAKPFTIGRKADLSVDDNPYLHRNLARISASEGFWWLTNVGSGIALTVSDRDARVQAILSPGSALPLTFPQTVVRFSAGPTLYEVDLLLDGAIYAGAHEVHVDPSGDTTVGPLPLTEDQHLLLVALAERALKRGTNGVTSLPSSAEAAERLGWPLTTFNRKLDALCAKMEKAGVPGLHGGPSKLASSRRAKLVEHALAVRLVEPKDLDRLP